MGSKCYPPRRYVAWCKLFVNITSSTLHCIIRPQNYLSSILLRSSPFKASIIKHTYKFYRFAREFHFGIAANFSTLVIFDYLPLPFFLVSCNNELICCNYSIISISFYVIFLRIIIYTKKNIDTKCFFQMQIHVEKISSVRKVLKNNIMAQQLVVICCHNNLIEFANIYKTDSNLF